MDPLPVKEFRRLDINSEELGVPVRSLMARAGKALAEQAKAARKGRFEALPVVLLCGKGNNGGDGFAAAGVLERWGIPYEVVLVGPRPTGGASKAFLGLLPREHVHAWKGSRRSAWKGAIVLDCMLGSGIRGPPKAPFSDAIKWARANAGHIIACDVPSGLGTRNVLVPHETVTFHAPKHGMDKATCGTITVASIGIPKDAGLIGLGDLDAGFIRPGSNPHKGDHGRVLIVGGGPFTGAPHYAGMGAVRSGADMVHVATTAAAAATISTWGPDLLVHAVEPGPLLATTSLPAIEGLLDRVDVMVLGPGLGDVEAAFVDGCVQAAVKRGCGMVIDADALARVDISALRGRRVVLTPHGAEFKSMSGKAPTPTNVTRFAKDNDITVVKKGATDLVAGTTLRRCTRGHPGMTVGGTGDVLAGCIGALMARGAEPFDAACAGTYILGCAGETAAAIFSHGLTATDVINGMPSVLRRL